MSPYNLNIGYRHPHLSTPSPQPNSPVNNFHNQSNTPSPYGFERISPDVPSIYNATPSPQPQPVQNQQFLTSDMASPYNYQNNLNSPYHSMPGSNDPSVDYMNNGHYDFLQYTNLNAVNTHQNQQVQRQPQQQQQFQQQQMHQQHLHEPETQNLDSNLNILDSEGLKTSDLMDIDSGQLLKMTSTEILSNLSLS